MSLLTSLVAHWPLEESSGSRFDAHASFDLGVVYGVDGVAGKLGNCAEFPDGESGYLVIEEIGATDLALGDVDFTVACWAKVGARGGLLFQWVGGLYCYTATGGALVIGCGGDEYSGETFALDTWQLIIIDYRPSDNRLRIHQSGTTTATAEPPGTGTDLVLGDNVGTTGDRWVDSFSVWTRILTDDERTALYNSGGGLDYADFDLAVKLAASVTGASTVTGAMRVDRALDGTVTGASSGTGALRVDRALGGVVAGVSTVTGALRVDRALDGTVTGSSSGTGALRVDRALGGAVAGESTARGVLRVDRALGGTVTGESSATGALRVDRALVGTVTGASSGTGPLRVVRALGGAVAVASTVTGALRVDGALGGAVAAVSTVTGALRVDRVLSGTISGSSSAAGALRVDRALGGAAAGLSTVTGALRVDLALAGAVAAASAVTVSLRVERLLSGSVSAAATVAGYLTADELVSLAAAVHGGSAVTGALRVDRALEGTVTAASTVTGSLGVDRVLGGAVAVASTVTGALRVDRSLAGTGTGSSTVVAELTVSHVQDLAGTVTAAAILRGDLFIRGTWAAPFWFRGQAPAELAATGGGPAFTRAATAVAGAPVSSAELQSLARAVNDRLRSGLGDGPWRIVYYVLGLFRQMRNPDADGMRWPALAEFFEAYQQITPADGDWPLMGPGEPEGANVGNPLAAYLFGNESRGLDSEAAWQNGIPLLLPDGRPAATPAEQWALKLTQCGSPARNAARAWGAVSYGRYSPHLTSWGGYLPTPDLLPEACDDPNTLDGSGAPPNYAVQFTATAAGIAAGYADKIYAGTCATGPSIDPPDKYDSHVAAIGETPWAWLVLLNNGTVEVLPTAYYVQGPYTGPPKLRKTEGGQLPRALARGAAEFRGERQQATAVSAIDAGAADKPTTWLEGAFDAQAFLTRQYPLAEVLALPMCRGDVVGPLTWVGEGAAHLVPEGRAIRHLLISASDLTGTCALTVEVSGVQVVACTLTPAQPAQIVALGADAQGGDTVTLTLRSATAGARIVAQACEQESYKPDLSDLIACLRRATHPVEGPRCPNPVAVTDQLSRYGFLTSLSEAADLQDPTQYTGHPVYEAARRWSQVVRILPRRQFVGYAVENGKSVLWFRRYARPVGGANSRVRVTEGAGEIQAGVEYEVTGTPDDAIDYRGGPVFVGEHFLGVVDTDGTGNDFYATVGTPEVYAITRGLLDQPGGGDQWAGIVEQIAHEAPAGGFTNEWVLGTQFKPYHPSSSSLWKPEVHADYFPLHDRATFYSPEIANELDQSKLWQAAYGQRVPGAYGGNLLSEWPTGYRYAPLTTAWAGHQFLNDITVGSVTFPTDAERNYFRRSCRIYEPDLDVESAEAVTEGAEQLVKVTLTGRLHSTYGETGGAPARIARDRSGWVAADIAAEPYRTAENALRLYLLHATTGQNFGATLGDNAANSYVQSLPDNPYASIYPHFYLVKLVPEPRADDNARPDPGDTPLFHDPLAQVELYLRAICEGYVDHHQSTERLVEYVAAAGGVLPESWGLHDYSVAELCRQAFGGSSAGIMPSAGGVVAEGQLRPDFPHGFGPWPGTRVSAEVFNRLSRMVNLLTRVRLMVPYEFEIKTDVVTGYRTHLPAISLTLTGVVSVMVDRVDFPEPDTPLSTGSWAVGTTATSLSSGGLWGETVDGGDYVVEAQTRSTSQWRATFAEGIEEAFPPVVAALAELGGVQAIAWYTRTRENRRRVAAPYADSEGVDDVLGLHLGWYQDGSEYYRWDVGEIKELEQWAEVTTSGAVEAAPAPEADCGLGRTGAMATGDFEAEGGGSAELTAELLPGATLCLTVPLV